MCVNPIHAGIPFAANHIKNQGPSRNISISEEALEKLETSVREGRFDSFQPEEGFGIRRLEELDTDVIEKVLEKPKLFTTFTSSQVSAKARELSLLMDERPCALVSQLKKVTLVIGRDQLAQHFGEVGRKLDESFAAGEITQREYDDLNRGLEKYTETVTAREEHGAAVLAVLRKTAKMEKKMLARGASQTEMEAFYKWHRETLADRINEFIKKSREYDRGLMATLIQKVRNGGDLISKEPSPKETMAGYWEKNSISYLRSK